MGKIGTTAFTTAQEADKLEALLSAAGLAAEQIDQVWSRFVGSGYKAAEREFQRMTTTIADVDQLLSSYDDSELARQIARHPDVPALKWEQLTSDQQYTRRAANELARRQQAGRLSAWDADQAQRSVQRAAELEQRNAQQPLLDHKRQSSLIDYAL